MRQNKLFVYAVHKYESFCYYIFLTKVVLALVMQHCASVLDACIICTLDWICKILLVHLFTKYVLGLLMCAFKVLMKNN